MCNLPKKHLGFTMMQLLVTVALIGIISSIAMPSLTGLLVSNKLTAYANQLVTGLNVARSEAVKRNTRVTLRKKGDSGYESGWNIFLDTNGNNTFESGTDTLIKTFEAFPSGYTLIGNNVIVNFIAYQADGTSNVSGSFAVCYAGHIVGAKLVTVNTVGRIRTGTDKDKDGIPEKEDGTEMSTGGCTSP